MAGEVSATQDTTTAETTPAADASLLDTDATTKTESPAAEVKTDAASDGAKTEEKGADAHDLGPSLLGDDEEDKPTEKADGPADAKQDGESEAYQPFTLPEGVELDEAALAKATPVLRELNLDQEKAQKLVSFHAEEVQRRLDETLSGQRDGHKQLVSEWRETSKADPEIGGDKLNENLALAKKTLNTFGTPELKSMLREWGLDNNPEILRLLVRAGKGLSPDTSVNSDTATAPQPKSGPEAMWPGMYQK